MKNIKGFFVKINKDIKNAKTKKTLRIIYRRINKYCKDINSKVVRNYKKKSIKLINKKAKEL